MSIYGGESNQQLITKLKVNGSQLCLEVAGRITNLERVNKEWEALWKPIDELVSPLTPLGESVSLNAAKLIEERLKQIYD